MATVPARVGKSITFCLSAGGSLVSLPSSSWLPVYLPQERLRLVEKIGVRCEETLTVQRFEFTEHVDKRRSTGSISVP